MTRESVATMLGERTSTLPPRRDAPIYLDEAATTKRGDGDHLASLDSVQVESDYGLDMSL